MIRTHKSGVAEIAPPPGPQSISPLGLMRPVQNDPIGFLTQVVNDYGGTAKFRAGLWPVYVIAEPASVRHVLLTNQRNYSKNTFTYQMARSVAGEGLLTLDGDDWHSRRRLLQPIFSKSRIAKLDTIIGEITQKHLEKWTVAAEMGQPIDVGGEVNRLTLSIAAKAFFDVDIEAESDEITNAVGALSSTFTARCRSPLAASVGLLGLPLPTHRTLQSALDVLTSVVDDIIADVRKRPDPGQNILSQIIQAGDDKTSQKLTDQELHTEVRTLLLAGHETTARALTWAFYLLSKHSDVADKIAHEVHANCADTPPTSTEVPHLRYMNAALDETLRLYPSAWAFSRRAESDDVVCGYHVPKGARLLVSPYLLHHNSAFWPDPDEFKPERFLNNNSIVPDSYIPFGMGPRQCIGKRFALLEAQIILATIVSKFTLHPISNFENTPAPSSTLTPTHPIQLKLILR